MQEWITQAAEEVVVAGVEGWQAEEVLEEVELLLFDTQKHFHK